jgi:cytochrome c biogenesis protein CcmG, thiol:disulfide interchange protein DsbE
MTLGVRLLSLVGTVVLLLVAADLSGALDGSDGSADTGSPMVGAEAPPLTGKTVAGGRYRLESGGVTVVNVWASWCAPCRDELPAIARFAREWGDKGVEVVTIDTRDGIDAAREFLEESDAEHLPAVHDPEGRLAVSWGATGVPETYVLDADGVIRAHHAGPVDEEWLTREVTRWRRS